MKTINSPKQWHHAYADWDGDQVVCSECRYEFGTEEDGIDYCPSCHAEMIWDIDIEYNKKKEENNGEDD